MNNNVLEGELNRRDCVMKDSKSKRNYDNYFSYKKEGGNV